MDEAFIMKASVGIHRDISGESARRVHVALDSRSNGRGGGSQLGIPKPEKDI
jgi:hypothetical protein